MEKPTILDRLEMCSKAGHTSVQLNLYPKQEMALLRSGFSVQRLRAVQNYPDQHNCRIDWRYADQESFAYEFLKNAAHLHPELLHPTDGGDNPVPPSSHSGGWELP